MPPHPCSVSATSGHQQSTNQRGVNYLVCTNTHSHPVYSGGPDWKGGYYPGEIITSYDPRDTIVPPPYSSTTYADFDQFGDVQIERAFNLSELYPTTTTTSAHQQSASTLPRSMTIMSGKSSAQSTRSEAHHVANVYEVKEHPVHKYWTLPRSIATGSGVATFITPHLVEDEVDQFHQHHQQLQQTRIKEIAEQKLKPVDESVEGKSAVPNGSGGSAKQIVQHVISEQTPPQGATLLYETDEATFYTVPLGQMLNKSGEQFGGEEDVEISTGKITTTTTTYSVPKKKAENGIGPVNESGVPITTKAVS